MNSTEHFAPIAALDLDMIKVKLMHKESGEGWSQEYADAVEFEYRRFLYLAKKFPNEQTAPFFDVDVFWHYHILDTMKYATDCEAVFGYFLHHFPYVGLRGEEDPETNHRAGERMRELYEQTYGEESFRQEAPAYEAASSKVAFCSPATDEKFSAKSNTMPFPSPDGKVAFCSPNTKSAFGSPTAKFAFCSPNAKFAFCSPNSKVAFCSPNSKVVFCSPTATAVPPEEATEAANSVAPGSATALFYSVRPTLSRLA
jgi:hypothetical protein